MITVIDYGLGNIQAFTNMYKRLGYDVCRATNAAELVSAEKLVLPGVGAFDHAMELLGASGMRAALDDKVLIQKVPVLGVCVGMQMLADSSDEGRYPGLGWIPGKVKAFKGIERATHLPLPHMGWNDVLPQPGMKLFVDLENDARFYF